MSPLRILIADDHDVVRHGLRALIETQHGWEVCAEATNGREAVEQAQKLKPEVIVMDISMSELNGLEATRQVRKSCPQTEVLILSMHESEELARQVVEAGARGYLLKSDAGRDLLTGIQALSSHKIFFTYRVANAVLSAPPGSHSQASKPKSRCSLTEREREIVQLLAEGKSNKEIAASLHISTKTAETHRANIMRKLNLTSFSELVRYAIRNKIVEP